MFNTSYGYGVADKILSKLRELLKNDSRVTDEIYRYFRRRDEFLFIAYKTNLSDAKKAGDQKRILINDTNFMIDQNSFKLTVSCGLTEIVDIDTEESLRNKLNIALLKVKLYDGKNRTETIT